MVKHKTLDWRGWLYGLFAGAIGGGATAVSAIPVGQIFGAAEFTARQLGAVFLGAAVVSVAMYLRQSPLPKVIEVDDDVIGLGPSPVLLPPLPPGIGSPDPPDAKPSGLAPTPPPTSR